MLVYNSLAKSNKQNEDIKIAWINNCIFDNTGPYALFYYLIKNYVALSVITKCVGKIFDINYTILTKIALILSHLYHLFLSTMQNYPKKKCGSAWKAS